MGYTHYFYRTPQLPQENFNALVRDVRHMLDVHPKTVLYEDKETPLLLAGGDGEGLPEITSEAIIFNGTKKHDLWHETFYLPRVYVPESHKKIETTGKERGKFFTFCKTAEKPYDLMVCATLIRAKYHLTSKILISSDGNKQDWQAALDFCESVFDFADMPF